MQQTVTIHDIYEHFHQRLGLEWLAGQAGADRQIETPANDDTRSSLIGHLNFIHPNLIQVIGLPELEHLDLQMQGGNTTPVRQLMLQNMMLAIITDNQHAPEALRQLADELQIPLLRSSLPSHELITNLGYQLGKLLAHRITLHGVFMEVLGSGVLLTGDSGIGKSELALELITRGHRLVADDAPEFARIAPDIINGSCPALLSELLEVRGLGILNIRAMFGDSAVKQNKYLRLIIRLIHVENLKQEEFDAADRLSGYNKSYSLLGVEIPEITLPVAPGRNLAVLVESAVRNHMLKIKGYDAAQDLITRQQQQTLQEQP